MDFVIGAISGAFVVFGATGLASLIRSRIRKRRSPAPPGPGGAGGLGPPAGDREPRRPLIPAGSGAAALSKEAEDALSVAPDRFSPDESSESD